jgi:shikimate dehydrogenase
LEDVSSMPALRSSRRILTGLLGRNIQRSRSPQMHHDEAQAQGLDLEYRLFDFAALKMDEPDLPVFLDALEASKFAGINVTHPYKQAIIPLLDELSDDAARVGAVNTVAFREGRRIGFNTDLTGFAESFRQGMPNAELGIIFQAGAGGAGAATANALLELGAGRISVFDPEEERARLLCEKLRRTFGSDKAEVATDCAAAVYAADGIVNSTPMGMAEHRGTPVPVDLITPDKWVADIVYFPLETELLRAAKSKGCRVLDGGGMAVYQAAGAFAIFTGIAADSDRMRNRFLMQLGEERPDVKGA